MDKRQLERRLRAIREPDPPRDLAVRLEQGIPDSFRRRGSRRPWRIGTMIRIGALAAAAGAIIWVVSLMAVGTVGTHVVFADVLGPVADATSGAGAVHMVLRMLTRDGEDFSFVNLEGDELQLVEVWLQDPQGPNDSGRARLVKNDRVYDFDGEHALLYLPGRKEVYEDTGFDSDLFRPGAWVRQLQHLPPVNVQVLAHERRGNEERMLLRASGVPTSPLEPSFFDQFDRETEVIWNVATNRLKDMRRWVEYKGERRLYLEVVTIDYAPRFDEAVFRLDLPPDVRRGGLSGRPLPPDQVGLGPGEAAERILDAAARQDRDTLESYVPSPGLVDWFMTHSIEIVSLGEPFRAGNYAGWYVPYEVRVTRAGIFPITKKHNLALRNDNPEGRWQLDGGW